jgi:hypothetical protein
MGDEGDLKKRVGKSGPVGTFRLRWESAAKNARNEHDFIMFLKKITKIFVKQYNQISCLFCVFASNWVEQ